MRHFLKFVFISIVIVIAAFALVEVSDKYKINILRDNVTWSIDNKNCTAAVDFDKDKDGNTYVAYKDFIKVIREEGTEDILFKDESLNIENIIFYNNKIYYLSDDKLCMYDIHEQNNEILLDKIPYKGKNIDRKLIIKDSKLLIAIGSATNSGVADNDGTCDITEIPYDTSPINITLSGSNYGEKKTGPFMAYGNSSLKGQKIECRKLANSSIVEMNLETCQVSLFACGIRNVTGWDVDSEDNLICIIGGMEDTGARPVKRDFDYLYKIDRNSWYGWPDYSGGDPIDSPRFKGDKPLTKIIENHPNKTVAGPLFQFDKLSSMKYLAIDKKGVIFKKDTCIYYDKVENMISSINKDYVISRLLKLKENSDIKGIKIKNNSVYILDSGIGCIYKVSSNDGSMVFNIPRSILIFFMVLLGVLVFIFMYRYNSKKTN